MTNTETIENTPFGNRVILGLAFGFMAIEAMTAIYGSKPSPEVAFWAIIVFSAGTNWRWKQPGGNHHSLIGHIYQAFE